MKNIKDSKVSDEAKFVLNQMTEKMKEISRILPRHYKITLFIHHDNNSDGNILLTQMNDNKKLIEDIMLQFGKDEYDAG